MIGLIVTICWSSGGLQEIDAGTLPFAEGWVKRILAGPTKEESAALRRTYSDSSKGNRLATWRLERGKDLSAKARTLPSALSLYRSVIRQTAGRADNERFQIHLAAFDVFGPSSRPFRPDARKNADLHLEAAAQAFCEQAVLDPKFFDDSLHFLSWSNTFFRSSQLSIGEQFILKVVSFEAELNGERGLPLMVNGQIRAETRRWAIARTAAVLMGFTKEGRERLAGVSIEPNAILAEYTNWSVWFRKAYRANTLAQVTGTPLWRLSAEGVVGLKDRLIRPISKTKRMNTPFRDWKGTVELPSKNFLRDVL